MPNWCNNVLVVRGKRDKLEEFRAYASGMECKEKEMAKRIKEENIRPLEEEQFIPVPDDVERHSDPNLMSDEMYKWRNENWGTKWGFCNVDEPRDGGEALIYGFDSAWSPPEPLVRKMGEMYPELEFVLMYYEPGMSFKGKLRIRDGKTVEDNHEKVFDVEDVNHGVLEKMVDEELQ